MNNKGFGFGGRIVGGVSERSREAKIIEKNREVLDENFLKKLGESGVDAYRQDLQETLNKLVHERAMLVREVGESGTYRDRISQYDQGISSLENSLKTVETFVRTGHQAVTKEEATSEPEGGQVAGEDVVVNTEIHQVPEQNSSNEGQTIDPVEPVTESGDMSEQTVNANEIGEWHITPPMGSVSEEDKDFQAGGEIIGSSDPGEITFEEETIEEDGDASQAGSSLDEDIFEEEIIEEDGEPEWAVGASHDVGSDTQPIDQEGIKKMAEETKASGYDILDETSPFNPETIKEFLEDNDGSDIDEIFEGKENERKTYTVLYDAKGNIRSVSAAPNFFNRQSMTREEAEKIGQGTMTPEEMEAFRKERRGKTIDEITGKEGTDEKQKKKKGFRKKLMIAAMAVGLLTAGSATIFAQPADVNIDQRTGAESRSEQKESEWKIKEGYGEKGMYLSENKSAAYNFVCGDEVAEVTKVNGEINECEMIKYVAGNQIECFADYLGNLPDTVKPDEYKGLTILQIEDKLESLSESEYKKIQEKFNKIIDDAFAGVTTIDGTYENAYMRPIDANKPVKHDNIELVVGVNELTGTKAIQLYWMDESGNRIGEMTMIWNCMQAGRVLAATGDTVYVYEGMEKIEENPEVPISEIVVVPEEEEKKGDEEQGGEEEKKDDEEQDENEKEEEKEEKEEEEEEKGEEEEKKDDDEEEQGGEEEKKDEEKKKKDKKNLERIDENISEDMEKNSGTEDVVEYQRTAEEKTEQPTSEAYNGTEAEIVQNETSKEAETVTPTEEQNDYSEDLGGANEGEYAPVEENAEGQEKADEAEMPIEEAPYTEEDLQAIINDLISQNGGGQ